MCEGGLRRQVEAEEMRRRTVLFVRNRTLGTTICEEETDAGERIPSSPQTDIYIVRTRTMRYLGI